MVVGGCVEWASFSGGAFLTASGPSVGHEAPLRWSGQFKRNSARPKWVFPLCPLARLTTLLTAQLCPGEVVEFHIDNAMTHLHSGDLDPRDAKHKRSGQLIRATGLPACREVQESTRGAQKHELVESICVFYACRAPELFKVTERGWSLEDRAHHTARSSSSQSIYGGGVGDRPSLS